MSSPQKDKKSSKNQALSARESIRRWQRAWSTFAPYARPHRKSFIFGMLPALLVVLCHLALPWPIKALVDGLIAGQGAAVAWNPIILGLSFFTITILLGAAEYLQRLWVARFSIAWVRDIRAESFLAASRVDPRRFNISTGDLVARLVGDTARLKAGLKGFLTHFATNALLFVGVTVVLVMRSWQLASIFFVTGFAIAGITWWGTWRLYNRYRLLRRKEGKLATRIEGALDEGNDAAAFARVNRSSGQHEASVVQIQGQITFLAHTLLGAATLLVLWLGTHLVETQAIPAGDLVLVMLYALKLARPGVRLARQGTRLGKMLALGDRLERLLREGAREERANEVAPLQQDIRLKGVGLFDSGKAARFPRLQNIHLQLKAGQRVAIVGGAGAGKSSLLSVLAARVAPSEGRLRWDGVSYHKLPFLGLSERITFQDATPFWLRKPLCDLLGESEPDGPSVNEVLKICGLANFVKRLPQGLDTAVASNELSGHQAQVFALAKALLATHCDLVLLDDPFSALPLNQVHQVLALLAGSRWRTVVIAMTRPNNLSWFDRVIAFDGGRVVFDGTPRAWQIASSTEAES